MPEKLYKYLPSQYVDNVLNKGDLLFRNLTFFRQYKDEQQGDPLEGHHRDNPDEGVVLTNLTTGKKTEGDFSFLNSTNSDLIFVFCMSKTYNENLYKEFKSDACITITDVEKFLLRTRVKIKHLLSCHRSGLLHDPVTYYAANKRAEFNIKDPKVLPFAKDETFLRQDEYRLVFGKKKAFKLVQRIVMNGAYDFREDAKKGTAAKKIISIGDISDIAHVQYLAT